MCTRDRRLEHLLGVDGSSATLASVWVRYRTLPHAASSDLERDYNAHNASLGQLLYCDSRAQRQYQTCNLFYNAKCPNTNQNAVPLASVSDSDASPRTSINNSGNPGSQYTTTTCRRRGSRLRGTRLCSESSRSAEAHNAHRQPQIRTIRQAHARRHCLPQRECVVAQRHCA